MNRFRQFTCDPRNKTNQFVQVGVGKRTHFANFFDCHRSRIGPGRFIIPASPHEADINSRKANLKRRVAVAAYGFICDQARTMV